MGLMHMRRYRTGHPQLNADMPYDDFVRQIAGDIDGDVESSIGTAFWH